MYLLLVPCQNNDWRWSYFLFFFLLFGCSYILYSLSLYLSPFVPLPNSFRFLLFCKRVFSLLRRNITTFYASLCTSRYYPERERERDDCNINKASARGSEGAKTNPLVSCDFVVVWALCVCSPPTQQPKEHPSDLHSQKKKPSSPHGRVCIRLVFYPSFGEPSPSPPPMWLVVPLPPLPSARQRDTAN